MRQAADASDGLAGARRVWSQAALLMAIFMTVVDGSIANVALPAIARELRASVPDSIWVVSAYQMTVTILLLPLASAGEILGFRRIALSGLTLFTLASLACALSHTLPLLIAVRILQGIGSAALLSVSPALLRHIVPRAQLGRAIGLSALTVGLSASIAPSIASAILSVATWPWLFAVNLPIGVIAIAIGLRVHPHTPRATHGFDWASAVLSAITLGLLIAAMDGVGHHSWLVETLLAALCLIGAIQLVHLQTGRAAPLLPVDLLGIPAFGLAVATSIGSFTAQGIAFVALPFHLEYGLGHGQVATGLLMTPWPLTAAAMSLLAGRMADRIQAGVLCSIGMGFLAAGLLGLATLPPHPGDLSIALLMAVCGLGFGLFQTPNNRAMLAAAPRHRSGGAGGLLGTARTLGQTLGAASAALAFSMAGNHAGAVALAVAAIVAGLAGAVSLSRLGLVGQSG